MYKFREAKARRQKIGILIGRSEQLVFGGLLQDMLHHLESKFADCFTQSIVR
jgi:hypothetical protein